MCNLLEFLKRFSGTDRLQVLKRTEGEVTDSSLPELGKFRTAKGAPKVILGMCDVDSEFRRRFRADNEAWSALGIRSIAVARTNAEGKWMMQGMLAFMDPPRPDAKETITRAADYGIAVKMITGDNYLIAKRMAQLLDLGTMCRTADKLPSLDSVRPNSPNMFAHAC